MPISKDFYVIQVNKIGRPLYAANGLYSLYPSTTSDVFTAKKFDDLETAEKQAKRSHGKIIHLQLSEFEDGESEDTEEEIAQLKKTIEKLKEQRDLAREQLKVYQDEN